MSFTSRMKSLCITLSLFIAVLLASCASTQECKQISDEANLGPTVNSPYDDYAPQRFRNSLVLSSTRKLNEEQQLSIGSERNETVFESERRMDASFAPADISRQLPLNEYRAGSPSFAFKEDSSIMCVFPRTVGSGKDAQVDIFQTEYRNGQWSEPLPISAVNTKAWESQPTLSADGSQLLFASDRSGGVGGIDLYISTKSENGWTSARNLGKDVNSSLDDITPSLDKDGGLYFSSNRANASSRRGLDIMRASDAGKNSWSNVELLPEPFNSDADDICPLVWGDSLFFASKRKGGCGGFDMYAVVLCGPVTIRGQIMASPSLNRRSGLLTILDSTGKLQRINVPEDGLFEASLSPNRKYMLRYINECLENALEQEFMAPCNETKSVVLQSSLDLPDIRPIFNFDEYNVPFFSTGYYVPNTTEQLAALRLKFSYNLLGVDEGTTYIKMPGEEYDQFAPIVDSAMNHAQEFILKLLEFRRRGCNSTTTNLNIMVEGFADSKPFAQNSRYDGETIDDYEFDLHVGRGDAIDNKLLASLRAYHTVKYLQHQLSSSALYEQFKKRIKWRIQAHGEDESAAPDTLKRRVELSVGELK